jgi:superfamily II DNA or RNA helicase
MELRKYQSEAIDKIENFLVFDSGREACLLAPTSWGKSVAILELVRQHQDKHITILVNISKLITQLRDLLKSNGISVNVIKAGMDEHAEATVTIAMQQTLSSRADLTPQTDYLLIDERHISFGTKTMDEIIDRLSPEKIIGFSATPVDSKGARLPVKLIETADIKYLTGKGFLTPVRTFIGKFSEQVDLSQVAVNAGDYSEVQLGKVLDTDEYNQQVVDSWKGIAEGLRTIVFASGVDHAESLTAMFKANGYDAMSVHSKKTKKDNERIMEMHKDGVFDILVSINMVAVGYDDPKIECGICCRPTMTWRLYAQMVGRVMRLHPSPTRSSALWLDFAQNTKEHGLYDEPYNFGIEPTDKDSLKKFKEERRITNTKLFADEEVKWVENRTKVEMFVEEVKNNASTIEQYIALFESSENISDILFYAMKIDSEANLTYFRDGSQDWILEPWFKAFREQPSMEPLWTKAFKTMAKNKIKDKKKLYGLHHSIKWLKENQTQGW